MAFKKRSYKKRAMTKKRSAPGGRKSSAVSSSVKQYVKRTLHAAIENKCVQVNQSTSFGTVNESPEFNAFPMCPLATYWNINQGVGQGNRVGNVIKIRKVRLNYILRPNPYEPTFNVVTKPLEIQLLLGYVKNTPSFVPVPGDIQQIFQAGSATTAPIGTTRDIISVINKDYWVIKKRWTHKIGYASNTGSNPQAAPQFFANNDFKLNTNINIDLTKYVPKTYTFRDNNSTPTTRGLYMMFQPVYANGNAMASTQVVARFSYMLSVDYEDA